MHVVLGYFTCLEKTVYVRATASWALVDEIMSEVTLAFVRKNRTVKLTNEEQVQSCKSV